MQIYTVIKEALDELYRTFANAEPDCDEAIWAAITRLTQRYENLNNLGGPINYEQISAQYAYLYKYAGARACAIYSRLNPSRRLAEIFESGTAIVTSLGAGPGSDMLGILKYRGAFYRQTAVTINLIDGVGPWIDAARIVRARVRNHLDGAPDPTVRFRDLNLTDQNIAASLAEYQNSTLFTLSYVLSELSLQDAARLLEAVIGTARPGTVLLVIDNNMDSVGALLDAVANNPMLRGAGVREGIITLQNENMNNLGPHLERFGDYERGGHPNIVLDARWLLATKV